MKLIANKYNENDIFKIIREWTGKTQEQLGKEMGKKGRAWAKGIENGTNRYYFQDFMKICNAYGIKVIIEK